ncbi:MAG: GNAT family N-acetyltransferase [Rhizobiales bacterium]|nr:GNAT family N-acetyltransferase [Hyphomicrobiales bacterium]
MAITTNGLPVGEPIEGWTPRPRPPRTAIEGRYCRIEPLDPVRHTGELHRANMADREGVIWTYLPYGPFASERDYGAWVEKVAGADDPLFHAIIDLTTGLPGGVASLMRITPEAGTIEVGHICYSPSLQGTRAASEAMFLLMRRAFQELGYRRYEWKCDALNRPSRVAAERLGFSFEGIFRQSTVVKGRNRDTAWYAMIDKEWPRIEEAFESYLDPANFDAAGRQRRALSALTWAALKG